MAVQVGGSCFASDADAAPHACASFPPVSQISGSSVVTVSCQSANPDGSLSMVRTISDLTGSAPPVTNVFTMVEAFPPCVQQDYIDAAEALAGPALALVIACWGLWRLNGYLGWGRADAS